MKRALAAIVLAAAGACGGGSTDAPAASDVDLATAGTVLEVAGTVTATPPSGPARALAKGDTVGGRETIATAADASITIQLAHNGARWSLAGGKQGVVRESVAWNLPKSTEVASAVAEDMSAGARHSEKSAADTLASAGASAGSSAQNAELEQNERDREAAKSKLAALQRERSDMDQRVAAAKAAATKAKSSGHATTAKHGCSAGDPLCGADDLGGLGLTGTGPGGGGAGDGNIGLGHVGTIGKGTGGGAGAGHGEGAGDKKEDAPEATEAQKQHLVGTWSSVIWHTCFPSAGSGSAAPPAISITVACTAGKCKVTATTETDAKRKACVAARIASWPVPSGTWTVTFSIAP